MSNTANWSTCRIVCWVLAGIGGVILLWGIASAVGFIAGLLAAVALTAFLGLVFTRLVCTGEGGANLDVGSGAAASAVSQAGAAVAEKAQAATSVAADAAKTAVGKVEEAASSAAGKGADAAAEAKDSAVDAVSDAADDAKEVTATAKDKVKSGNLLDGEEELANRKGDWSYTKPGSEAPKAEAKATPDYDGDGVHEGANEGTRPEALSAPKDGKADNLKEIKGVGPKLETMLNEMGFYHFDQIANWGADEVAWVDANLKGFKGRVSRDNWVEQAKILAEGGETEFSKRARGGDVY